MISFSFIFIFIFSLQISCSSRSGRILGSPEPINTNISSAEDYPVSKIEFIAHCQAACHELRHEIITLAKEQLRIKDRHFALDFGKYEIENWPEFVPFSAKLWDKQSYDDLKAALPNLVFKRKERVATRRSNNSKILIPNRMINRSKLAAKLLELFNEQAGTKAKFVKWIHYHLINWPVGVSLHINHFSALEVLTIFRHLDRIRFAKVAKGETRTVTYTDGTVVNADTLDNGKTKYNVNRKLNLIRKRRKSDEESEPEELEESDESEKSKESELEEVKDFEFENNKPEHEPEDEHRASTEHLNVNAKDNNDTIEPEDANPTKRVKHEMEFDEGCFDFILYNLGYPLDVAVVDDGSFQSLKHYNPDLDSFEVKEIN